MRYLLVLLFFPLLLPAQPGMEDPVPLQAFDTTSWTDELRTEHPRLILTPGSLDSLRSSLATDSILGSYYASIEQRADELLQAPVLERTLTGRRLLFVSREALRRTGTLGMSWLISGDTAYLDRLGAELVAVSNFTDWNPSHFLDVAEMSLAVAIGLDWAGEALPDSVTSLAYGALLHLGLEPSLASNDWWITADNNWNQVCHGGTIAAALTLAERTPQQSGRAIARAIRYLPQAMRTYAPDGAYPEGASYWTYATSYSVVTIEMLRSALGTDFGLTRYPGFLKSATFRALSEAPSGAYYNFADGAADAGTNGAEVLAWFAGPTGNGSFFQSGALMRVYREDARGSRFAALALPWIARATQTTESGLPLTWSAGGPNPIGILHDATDTTFYLAVKGGRGSISHGNLDAGSFIFELDSVRWAVDLGMQDYNSLEQLGFDLWGREQQAARWTLISKNNFNHSTLTVSDSLHRVDGFAPLVQLSPATFRIDLGEVLDGQVAAASRTFTKLGPRTFTTTDTLVTTDATRTVCWQLMTTTDVTLTDYGARLRQGDHWLDLIVEQPTGLHFSVVSLDPPPLAYDMQVPGLKRLELRLPDYLLQPHTVIRVRLTGAQGGEYLRGSD